MQDLVGFLLKGSPAALILFGLAIFIATAVAMLFVVAFFQGRSIAFWPPSIGERPKRQPDSAGPMSLSKGTPTEVATSPIVVSGTVLRAASGREYVVLALLSGGADATMYKAEDADKNIVVAKLFWRGLSPSSQQWNYFQQEHRAGELLHHRNIVRRLDHGLRLGYPFIVSEYFAGGTLRDWLEAHDRLPGSDIFAIATQVAAALDYAHSCGVIHRDVKPDNILFDSTPNNRVALCDFGIAAILGAVQRNITAIRPQLAGTANYLAPELISGHDPTAKSDIYGLAVVLFEMITKSLPYDDSRHLLAVIEAKTTCDAPNVTTLRANVPIDLATRLAEGLSRDPTRRPGTAGGLLSGLDASFRDL